MSLAQKINKSLEKYSQQDLKKLSPEEYQALSDKEKEEYKKKLFTGIMVFHSSSNIINKLLKLSNSKPEFGREFKL